MIRWIKNNIKFFLLKKRFPNSKIYFNAFIDENSQLGKNSVVFSNTVLINSSLGDYSYIQKKSEIIDTKIGKFCSIASDVTIGLANHPTNFISMSPVFYDSEQPLPFFFANEKNNIDTPLTTRIEADVWIGKNVIVKSGINIGVGAIIGAGAVVTKDVEPYSIVVGVPAKRIKYRFEKNLREDLLDSKWWECKDEDLLNLKQFFNEPKLFLAKLKESK